MKLSISEDNINFNPVDVKTLGEFVAYATKYNYSTGVFKDNYRKKANFLTAESIALDIDNDDPLSTYTMADAKEIFKDYAHIIMPSKSHQKEKNGRIADRFRIILFLDEPIDNVQDFTATWTELLKFYPAGDHACKDASRFYYPSPGAYSINETGKLWPVSKFTETETTSFDKISDEKGQLSRETLNFLTYGAPQGKRNQRLFKAAKDMQEQGFTIEECKSRVNFMIQTTGNWGTTSLNAKDIEAIGNAFKDNAKYEPRPNESIRRSVFNFQSLEELEKETGNVEWLVDGLLSVGGFSMIVGPPKAGKSTIVRQLIKNVCQGGTFLGREVIKGSVVYLTFEEQASILKEQFSLVGITKRDNVKIHVGAVFDERALEDLEEALYELEPNLVILDTLFDISQLEDINSYKAVKDALAKIRAIARNTNAHILGVHHTNKMGDFLGSQAIFGAVDTMINFTAQRDRRYITSKGKHGDFFNDQEIIYNPLNMSYTLGKESKVRETL